MGRPLGIKAGTQTPKTVCMVGFFMQLLGQLTISWRDLLTQTLQPNSGFLADLHLLVGTRQRQVSYGIIGPMPVPALPTVVILCCTSPIEISCQSWLLPPLSENCWMMIL